MCPVGITKKSVRQIADLRRFGNSIYKYDDKPIDKSDTCISYMEVCIFGLTHALFRIWHFNYIKISNIYKYK